MPFSLFSKNTNDKSLHTLFDVDIHSHLIFGVDDGARKIEDSITLIKQFKELGYKKLYTTPHIMGDFYPNNSEILLPKLEKLREVVQKEQIEIELHCAAEYYLDEMFIEKVAKKEKLLSINDKYVLFETGFMNRPVQMEACIFDLLSNGYKPIMAHPERYLYLHESIEKSMELKEKGILLQINLNSLTGYYSKPIKKYAEKLIDNGLVDFVGSDCHNQRHFDTLKKSLATKYYQKLSKLNILNKTL